MGVNMKMIQQMQNRMAKIQQELDETVVEGSSGGGVVVAKVSGSKEFQGIKIDPSAVDPEDVEMLEDLITAAIQDAMNKATELSADKLGALTAAIQDAMNKATELSADKLGALTGGMKIPGLM